MCIELEYIQLQINKCKSITIIHLDNQRSSENIYERLPTLEFPFSSKKWGLGSHQVWGLLGLTIIIGIVHFLKLVKNIDHVKNHIDHVKNHIDLIPIDMIFKTH